jgi:SAM-dependent methyltransferase
MTSAMDAKTSAALAELNRAFYTRFAGDFARTRRAWPPGFDLILPHVRSAINLLDLGCGNARLLTFLRERGWHGQYTGLDASEGLLAIASSNARLAAPSESVPPARFVLADLLRPDWPAYLGEGSAPSVAPPAFDAIAALAVIHHIPGSAQRARFLTSCAALLAPGGKLVISAWQFLGAPRLEARILPWQMAGIEERAVEPGDYLLSWGEGAAGRRYCAAVGLDALLTLGDEAGLDMLQTFYADGHEGNLNLYGIFAPKKKVS